MLQGFFGAALVPLGNPILLDIYTPEERGSAMALFGVSVMVGPVLGPVIGGWLTDHYSWRWVFYINVPIGVLAFAGISFFLRETKISAAAKLDWLGFGSLSIAIAAMQVFLDRGAQLDWFSSFEILIEATVCVSALYIFLVHTFTAKNSFVNPRLFLDRNFSVGMLFIFIVGDNLSRVAGVVDALFADADGLSGGDRRYRHGPARVWARWPACSWSAA